MPGFWRIRRGTIVRSLSTGDHNFRWSLLVLFCVVPLSIVDDLTLEPSHSHFERHGNISEKRKIETTPTSIQNDFSIRGELLSEVFNRELLIIEEPFFTLVAQVYENC